MVSKSIVSARSGKSEKPYAKPYPGFPLTIHPSGRWCKKIRQKSCYFGKIADDLDGADALQEFNRQYPYLQRGETPPPRDTQFDTHSDELESVVTIRRFCSDFLNAKRRKMASGELSAHTFAEYRRTTNAIVEFFGKLQRVDELRPADFERFRAALAKGVNMVTLKSEINRSCIVFAYANTNLKSEMKSLIDFGDVFERPSAKALRKAKYTAESRILEREEILSLLDKIQPQACYGRLLQSNG